MLTHRLLKSHLIACIAAGCIGVTTSTHAFAADCGCAVSCDVCPTVPSGCTCDCSGGCSSGKKKTNYLYNALDAFAGGVEKLLGLDKCGDTYGIGCDEPLCDDACDAAMIEELSLPPSCPSCRNHRHSPGTVVPPVHSPPVHSGPTRNVKITPTGPSQWEHAGQPMIDPPGPEMRVPDVQPRMTQPRMVPSEGSGQHLGGGTSLPEPNARPIPSPPLPSPPTEPRLRPEPEPKSERGSLFDALSNPFGDDEARARIPRPVRPSNYERPQLRPVRGQQLSRSYTESSRRVRSAR